MRIAVVTETYPPEVNGVAATVRHFVDGLAALGHEVLVTRPRQGPPQHEGDTRVRETTVAGAGIPRYPGLRFGLPSGRLLRRAWDAFRPDVAYLATEGPLGWSALRLARALEIPTASGFHTRFDDFVAHYGFRFLTPIVFAMLRRFHNGTDTTLVPTEELRAFLDRSRFLRVARLERGVDTQRFDPARRDAELRRAWGVADNELAVLHVGRLAPEKNLALVVRAFDAIAAARPGARLVWVGDGPARPALERGHPDHVWCGMQRGEALARHYASGDVFLFPSETETFGNVTLEALASGVPVVAYDYGAAGEYVRDRRNGRLAPLGDAAAFVAASVDAVADADALTAMRTGARSAVAHLSQGAVAQRLAALLTSLVETRRNVA